MQIEPSELRSFVWNMLCMGPPKRTLEYARAWNAQADTSDCNPIDIIECLQEFERTGFATTDGYRWYLSEQGLAYRNNPPRPGQW